MTLTAIVFLILAGLILLLLEILVIPGFIVGVIGLGLMAYGIINTYEIFGNNTGNIVLIGTLVSTIILVIISLRSKTWKNAALHTSLHGKTNSVDSDSIKIGDKGITVSRLAPIGRASINEQELEVHSSEGFINQNTHVIICKIMDNKIFVKKS